LVFSAIALSVSPLLRGLVPVAILTSFLPGDHILSMGPEFVRIPDHVIRDRRQR
jgi:hypothetical protein